jgi:cyclin C
MNSGVPDGPERDEVGSHEEFWVFSQVSQWGSHWSYSDNDHLNQVRNAAVQCRQIGLAQKLYPRLVHCAQLLIWRFYLKEKNLKQYHARDVIALAFESAMQLLDRVSCREQVLRGIAQSLAPDNTPKPSEFQKHFNMIVQLNFEVHVHHPSDYLKFFITSQFTGRYVELAETIISDTFMCPCCLVHSPATIAEGSAMMAAGMLGSPGIVRPKTARAISLIRDMKFFYEQSMKRK